MNKKANKAVDYPPPPSILGYPVEAAARIIGTNRTQILRLVASGDLEMHQPFGKRKHITEKSLRALVRKAAR